MPDVGDVVRLTNGWVGVIGGEASRPTAEQRWLVFFPNSRLDVPASDIAATLVAEEFSIGQTVTVWPDQGSIQTLTATEATVTLERTEIIPGGGRHSWSPTVTVPRWKLTRDNDTQLSRDI